MKLPESAAMKNWPRISVVFQHVSPAPRTQPSSHVPLFSPFSSLFRESSYPGQGTLLLSSWGMSAVPERMTYRGQGTVMGSLWGLWLPSRIDFSEPAMLLLPHSWLDLNQQGMSRNQPTLPLTAIDTYSFKQVLLSLAVKTLSFLWANQTKQPTEQTNKKTGKKKHFSTENACSLQLDQVEGSALWRSHTGERIFQNQTNKGVQPKHARCWVFIWQSQRLIKLIYILQFN